MTVNVTTFNTQEYADTVELLLQTNANGESRLRAAVTEEPKGVGKQGAFINQVGQLNMQEVTTRFGEMPRQDVTTARRWILPKDYDLPQLVDKNDLLRMTIDPKNAEVMVAAAAGGRQIDDTIITAFYAAVTTGETGSGSTSFDSAHQIAVNYASSGNVGLTVAKLREARRLMMSANVDLSTDPVFCAITAQQHDDLLAEAQVISADFNTKPVLVDGRIAYFLGITFLHTERLGVDSSSYRRVPVWVKSGMRLKFWNQFTSDIGERRDLRGIPWQIYVYMTLGAARAEEGKVIEVLCSEA